MEDSYGPLETNQDEIPRCICRHARRIGSTGNEKVYYMIFKKDGKGIEEKAGRQYANHMTPARAAGIRAERIEVKRLSRKNHRSKPIPENLSFSDRDISSKSSLRAAPRLSGDATRRPVFQHQPLDPFKILDVVGHQFQTAGPGMTCDHHVVGP